MPCRVLQSGTKTVLLLPIYTYIKPSFLFSVHKRRGELTQHNHAEEAADHLVKSLQTSQCSAVQFYILWFMLPFLTNKKLVACMMTLFIVLRSFQSLKDSFPVSQQLICSSVCVKWKCLRPSFSTVKMLYVAQNANEAKYLQVKLRKL